MLFEEIQARKAEIESELNAEGITEERLAELETEVDALNAEEREIVKAAEERKALEEAVKSNQGEEITPENNNKEIETMDYRSAFLKNLQGRELNEEERAALHGTATIPTETMDVIVHKLEASPLYNAIDVTFFPGYVTYPVESTCTDAAWVAMTSAATDGEDYIDSVALSAYKLIKTVEITADVAALSVDAFEDYLAARLADKLLKAIDIAVLTGNGSNKATGIATTKATADTTYTSAGVTYADICSIIGTLPTPYHANASFVMSRSQFFGDVLGMQATGGERIVVADAQSPAKFNILGYPVIVDDNVATGDILFGDFKAYKFNFAKPIEIASDDSVEFRKGSKVYRAMTLADGKLVDAKAIVRAVAGT